MDTAHLDITTLNTSQMEPQLARLRSIGIGMFVAGAVLSVLGLVMTGFNWTFFFTSYLAAYLFWLGVTTGSLALLMVHNVVGGGWGFILRRLLEAATRLLPIMAVLYLPLIFGFKYIYAWAQPEVVAKDPILQGQTWWMNMPFFLARVVIMFGSWIFLATVFGKWSAAQDTVDDPTYTEKLSTRSAPCIVWYVVTITCLAIDWVMTITPHWVSSIIGFLYVVGQGLSTWALMAILVTIITSGKGITDIIPQRYFRDIGNFTLAFTMLWGYMSFSQYLITYSGNQAEESSWYVERAREGWPIIGFSLIALHFAVPFLTLLSSSVKVRVQNLAKLGCFIIFMRFVDLYWWTTPHFRGLFRLNTADIGLPLFLGGIWLVAWTLQMKDRQLIPKYDTRWQKHWLADQHHAHEAVEHSGGHGVAAHVGEGMEHGHA